jgi:hypothetical protein
LTYKIGFYRFGRLVAEREIAANDALPEVPEADSVRIFGPQLVSVPEERPLHGPGCHCVTCIRILSMDSVLNDPRIARRMLHLMALEIERWREAVNAMGDAQEWQVRKRWAARREYWRLRRELEAYRAGDAAIERIMGDQA